MHALPGKGCRAPFAVIQYIPLMFTPRPRSAYKPNMIDQEERIRLFVANQHADSTLHDAPAVEGVEPAVALLLRINRL
jgi:hypothetical protein